MDLNFKNLFYDVNICSVLVFGFFSGLLIFLQIPRKGVVKHYHVCRMLLIAAYLTLTIFCLIDLLHHRFSPIGNFEIALFCTTAIATALMFLFPLALGVIMDAEYAWKKKLLWGGTVNGSLIIAQFVALVADESLRVFQVVHYIFVIWFIAESVWAVWQIKVSNIKALKKVDALTSGMAHSYLKRVERVSWAAFVGGMVGFLFLVFHAWELLFGVAAVSLFTFTWAGIEYLNYQYVFSILIPDEDLPDSESSMDGKACQSRWNGVDFEVLLGKLDACMQAKKLWREPELTIHELSEFADMPQWQLSGLLNTYLGMNFRTYVNTLRIQDVCSMLLAYPEKSILETSLECGFNSKSVFNTVFRQTMGATPREWRMVRLKHSDSKDSP